ncbi:MAG: THUMP domain-containing protein [Candidatus Zixiibacteriota bacterium]
MIAKTLFGLENILAEELTSLGARDVKPMIRSVEFLGDKKLLYKANLWCRTATRILKPVFNFRASNEKVLYNKVFGLDWRNYLRLNQTFLIDAVITESGFDNSLYVAQKTKDAIADNFRKKTGQRPSVDLKNPDIRINVYIYRDDCTIALDASGEPLFKRGYRKKTGEAPLNEVLAAGIVIHSGWDKKSAFVDAMCGSGTIIIEAALMARNIAPGLTRERYAFMNWADFDKELFKLVRHEARSKIIPRLDFEMVGSDKASKQVREASDNARSAGVGPDIVFKQSPIENLIPPSPPGTLIINPPYGERMSVDDIRDFYHSIGDALKKNFTGYDAHIFTGNLEAARHIGLRSSRRIAMYNGPLECRLLKFEMYKGTRKKK